MGRSYLHSLSSYCDINLFVCINEYVIIVFKENTHNFLISHITEPTPGAVGMIIMQALGFVKGLQLIIRELSELENQMTSVERVIEYMSIDTEDTDGEILERWPKIDHLGNIMSLSRLNALNSSFLLIVRSIGLSFWLKWLVCLFKTKCVVIVDLANRFLEDLFSTVYLG